MSTKIVGKIVYTIGGSYPNFIHQYLEGYTIIHYYTKKFMTVEYTKSFERYLREKSNIAPFNPIIEEEIINRDHPFYDTLFEDNMIGSTIYKVTLAPNVSSNQEAQFVLKKDEW